MDESARLEARRRFVEKFRYHLAGFGLYGICHETGQAPVDGPIKRAAYATELPAKVEAMLIQMFDTIMPPKPATKK